MPAINSPTSANFGFLVVHDRLLDHLGALAERYFADDPSTCLLKLRQFGEVLAQRVAARAGLYASTEENQAELLARLRDHGLLPREIGDLFHGLRRAGNAAAHDVQGDHREALYQLRMAQQLGVWFHRGFKDRAFKPGPFVPPPDPKAETAALSAGDIAEIVGGGTPSAGDPVNFAEDGIPWLTPADLSRNRDTYVKGGGRSLSQIGYDNSGAQLLPKGAVLFSSRAPIGYCAIAERPLCTNQGFKSLVLQDGIVPEYVRHYLLASKSYAESEASGTTFLELSGARMRSLSLPIAPTADQKRIVAKVEELTARNRRAKEALDAVLPLLDQLRQSILAAAFRGDLTADWRSKNPEVEPADKLLVRIRAERRSRWEAAELARLIAKGNRPTDDTWKAKYREPAEVDADELPELPAGWAWTTLDALSWDGPSNGYSPKSDSQATGSPTLRLGATTQGRLVLNDETTKRILETIPAESDYWLQPGDLLVQRANSLEYVGTAAIYDGPSSAYIYPDLMMRLRIVHLVDARLVWRYLNSLAARHYFRSKATGTAGNMPKINGDTVRGLMVPLPSREEMVALTTILEAGLTRLEDTAKTLDGLSTRSALLESAILAKAFRGELVRQDLNDEPAAVLLERIRAARESAEQTGARTRRQSRKAEGVAVEPEDGGDANTVTPIRPDSPRAVSKDLSEVEHETLLAEISAALWRVGPLEKDEAVRHLADHLRQSGYVQFEHLRADGPLFGRVLEAIELGLKAGRLDRPKRGHVRACKADATTYSADDWRHALVASLGTEPVNRDDAIRAAAEWARDNLGLRFSRLRGDGHIVEGLRSAINSAIRRGDVIRQDPRRISRARLTPTAGRSMAH